MSAQIASANVVIVAKQFNPSIVTQLWLVDNGIVAREDFQTGCAFTEVISQVVAREFTLFISPQQLQFAPNSELHLDRQQDVVSGVLGRFVQLLPHTPYIAVGLNCIWRFEPENTSVRTRSRELFFRDENPLFRAFDTEDARFGGYLSKDALGCRMKLDVKPLTEMIRADRTHPTGREWMQFSFNFHLELGQIEGSPVGEIQKMLTRWGAAVRMSHEVMGLVQGGNQ